MLQSRIHGESINSLGFVRLPGFLAEMIQNEVNILLDDFWDETFDIFPVNSRDSTPTICL